jgi:hypothetical protein
MAKSRHKGNGEAPSTADSHGANDDRDLVARRAYELYLARGGGDGQDMEDWLIAEMEVRGRADVPPDES